MMRAGRDYNARIMKPARRRELRINKQHVGCNVTTCPNGKCRATGECVDRAKRADAKPEKAQR